VFFIEIGTLPCSMFAAPLGRQGCQPKGWLYKLEYYQTATATWCIPPAIGVYSGVKGGHQP